MKQGINIAGIFCGVKDRTYDGRRSIHVGIQFPKPNAFYENDNELIEVKVPEKNAGEYLAELQKIGKGNPVVITCNFNTGEIEGRSYSTFTANALPVALSQK